ncbi:MAG: phosphoribosylformylglycinamidine synthase [Bacteroidales bacterium]|nr:phosphoribosylformylglycinamidine synthase [Bacteroidales bacterium]
MLIFSKNNSGKTYAVKIDKQPDKQTIDKLSWLLDGEIILSEKLAGLYIGPRKEMITPWSTNAVEITQNMGIQGIMRIEEFFEAGEDTPFDPMLQVRYHDLDQDIFTIDKKPEPIIYIEDIKAYNQQEGLALNEDEIKYLEDLSKKIGRKLTDSEVFGFSQVNSEHCRHKIFNGTFIIDGKEMPESLFGMIRKTSNENPNKIISAYKDNVAFVAGPEIEQFAPERQDTAAEFETRKIKSVLSLKAETHNFPTTVEPFNGAATGSGGEIRDRLAGGKGSLPLAGTAVYMTPYSRLEKNRAWETIPERNWLYQTPIELLIKASNGASDFGNKFGQPLICGSVLTFEHQENEKTFGYDKVIMLAGGIGFGKMEDAQKDRPEKGDKVVLLGGENYRIGMGGGAVSSVDTGEYESQIELNAVQRSNPEMQKRAANAIRAMVEAGKNPIVSIHDHGAGGHLNSLSELVEETGGVIEIDKLPVGDPTLSAKEIIGNESQERMGLVMKEKDINLLEKVAKRERSPMYVIGEATGDHKFTVVNTKTGEKPIDLSLFDFFGNPPKRIMRDETVNVNYAELKYDIQKFSQYLENVLQLEAVACKDWLTNKVDRSVTGKVARQQTTGDIQLPLSDLGATALDYQGKKGLATSIGHAPVAALINAENGSVLSIAEALTNIVWAPLSDELSSISLSANWMWPCNNKGEDARLYKAVQAASDFAIALGINIPTGKDSLSMTQKYNNEVVYAPGTVIISAAGEVENIRKIVTPDLKNLPDSELLYIDFSFQNFELGGSSFAQSINKLGTSTPTVNDTEYFIDAFNTLQQLIKKELIIAGHDISAGGMITTLLEMSFPSVNLGLDIDLSALNEKDLIKILFSENPGVIIQVRKNGKAQNILNEEGIGFAKIAELRPDNKIVINQTIELDKNHYRDVWFKTSYLLDREQSTDKLAKARYKNYKSQPLQFKLPENFSGKFEQYGISPDRDAKSGIKAAIIREKGVNGDREMAYSMYLAGFDVKDVHMTDLINGRENLEDVNFIVFVGGFSNSDVLGSAKGWAGAFLYNEKANTALKNFYARKDTLSLGVCNGCQLMVELNLLYPEHQNVPKMLHNDSGKFESAYLNVEIPENDSVMLKSLSGSRLGIWVAHGEGKFYLPKGEDAYKIPMKYAYSQYPANPNGSDFDTAALVSEDGRHLAMMPHLERAIFPWQCASYPEERKNEDITPWIEAFVNARKWIESKT